ncbi:MAG: tol-pal system protein YbgF [Alphaproteobacteria bacterium]
MKLRLSLLVTCALLAALPASAQTGPNYETRLSTLENEIRAMQGRVEQVEYATRRFEQTLQRLQADYDARLTRIERGQVAATAPVTSPPPAPSQVSTPEAPAGDVSGSLGAIKTQDGRVTGAVNNPKVPPLPDTPADYGLTPQEQYERAFDILRKADYAEAEKAFKTFIDKNPKEKLIENAKYWYGETLYVQNKYNEAAVAFVDAYQQNPQGAKAPDCLLKLGLSLSGMNKPQDACTTLSELKTKFPKAAANIRGRADEERAKLKCGAR